MDFENHGDEVEEELYSKTRQNYSKIKEFKEYLASHDIMLAFVKCIKKIIFTFLLKN